MFSERLVVTVKVPNTIYSERKPIGMVTYISTGKAEAMINLRSVYELGLAHSRKKLKQLVAKVTGIEDVKIVFFPYKKGGFKR